MKTNAHGKISVPKYRTHSSVYSNRKTGKYLNYLFKVLVFVSEEVENSKGGKKNSIATIVEEVALICFWR